MKIEMSQKDKNLLVFLSMFVIVVCIGYWGVYPAISSIGEIENEIEDEESTKSMNEFKISQLPLYQADNEKLEGDISDAKGNYYPMMTNDEIDKYFTELVMDYDLLSYDLTIGESDVTDLDPYQYSKKAQEAAAAEELANETASSSSSDSTDVEDVEDATSDDTDTDYDDVSGSVGIYTVSVSLRLGGEEENILRFIDDMSTSDQKLRVCSYSWSGDRNVEYDDDGNYTIDISRILNINIEIYMCEE